MCAERADPGEAGTRVIALGNLSLNLDNYQTTVGGHQVQLTYDEFELLSLLAAKVDRIIPYDSLVHDLWDAGGHGPLRHLNVLVHRLRAKLVDSRPYEITTVRNRGYGLVKAIGGPNE